MWGWAALYFLFSILTTLPGIAPVISLAFLLVGYLLFPMFANAIYYRHVKQKIQKITSTTADEQKRLQLLAAKGGTSNVVWIILVILIFIGILAAIALPAYQDYVVRSKMSEALEALAEAKTVIASHVAENGRYPADFGSLNIYTGSRPESDIMASLVVERNVSGETVRIVANVASCIWEGGLCNDTDYKSFHLAGTINPDGTMTWECHPGDQDGDNAVAIQYLPAPCRN
jgi:type IV pilus assembly protein PilA